MLQSTYPIQFKAKRWIFFVATYFSVFFSIFCLIMGPLFLAGMKDAKGEPAMDAGLYMTLLGVPSLMIFSLKLYRVITTREPLLKIAQEGIVHKFVAMSSLDRIPLIPGILRIFWLAISGQGFRSTLVCIPWESFRSATVSGPKMAQILTIESLDLIPNPGAIPSKAITIPKFLIHQVELKSTLQEVADSILFWSSRNATERKNLPSWFEWNR